MKCPVCNQRKAKRECPAKRETICARCCGELRVVKIPCPADCAYLASGQAYHWMKKYTLLVGQEDDGQKRELIFRTVEQYHDALAFIEKTIVEFASSLSSMRDSDVREAIHLVKETYRTEARGVIYEHTSANPLAQALQRELYRAIEEYREDLKERDDDLSVQALTDCFEVVEIDVGYHLRNNAEGSGYLNFINRSHPEVAVAKKHEGIILSP